MKNTMIAAALGAVLLLPIAASAQSNADKASHHRQQTKNQWRNIGIGTGAAGIYGLLKHDNTMAAIGLGGAAYSFSRYEHDRRSQSKIDRARAAQYSHSSIYRNGHRYNRQIVNRNGQRYYQYVRAH